MTIGSKLASLLDWANKLGLQPTLALVIDATRTLEHPHHIGTALGYLRMPESQRYLRNWQDEVALLPDLLELLEASSIAPYIYEQNPAAPRQRAIVRQLVGGSLGDLPLLALLARPLPPCPQADSTWIEALRCWFFVQFLNAAFTGCQPNPYLVNAAEKLRMGIDTEPAWFTLFSRLRGPFDSFHGITRHLATRTGALRGELADARPIELTTLRELEKFAQGKWPSGQSATPMESGRLFSKEWQASPASQNWGLSRQTPDSDEDVPGVYGDSATDLGLIPLGNAGVENNACQIVGVDENETPVEQERKATGILLASIEDRQVLPFSWNRPNTAERKTLKSWLIQVWAGSDANLQELAALVWLSALSSNSLRTVMRLELGAEPAKDWRIDVAGGLLHRLPPRRYNSWHADGTASKWVSSLAPAIQIPLPEPVARAVQSMHARAQASTLLGQLWRHATTAEQQFNQACAANPDLQRVTSGMLSRLLGQLIFESTQDQTLALLLSSHPHSGLPAACAYSAYSAELVLSALQAATGTTANPPEPSSDKKRNAAGSELDPIEELLKQACADAIHKVNRLAIDPRSWAAHHNALIAYVAVMLMSATGARPIRSPFESIDWIDLQNWRIFIADKVSSQLHDGRLVPLPPLVVDILEHVLRPHLKRLSRLLKPIDSLFSKEVERLADWQASTSLPLLFLISTKPELAWTEVSEKTLSALEIFEWPLPWNLMRHRLATALTRRKVDHEIVNGLMGHSEQGTSPYGPYSLRILADDIQACAPALDELLAGLQFSRPIAPIWPESEAAHVPKPSGGTALRSDEQFGQDARTKQRQDNHRRAKEVARQDIDTFLADRPVDSLSADDWEKLSQRMLLTTQGLPHPMGSLRYDAMRKWISDRWQKNGSGPRLKKRYLPLLEESSPITALSIRAPQRLRAAAKALAQELASITPSKVSINQSLMLGIACVACESRVADKRVLDDLANNRNYQLVTFTGLYYLEHSPVLHQDAQSPRFRYRITEMAAALLSRAVGSTIKIDAAKTPLPKTLHAVAEAAQTSGGTSGDYAKFIQSLRTIIDQVNWQEYPGLVAAYLGGHVVTAALNHADWARVHRGYAVSLLPTTPEANIKQTDHATADEEDVNWIGTLSDDQADEYTFMGNLLVETTGSVKLSESVSQGAKDATAAARKAKLQQDAHAFFAEIRKEISNCTHKKSSPRKNLDSALRKVITTNPDVSLSCRLLAEWVRSLLWRRTSRGDLKLRSVLRYFNALSTCFEAVAYEHDLSTCDAQDVTEFYVQIMQARLSLPPQEPAQAATDSTESSEATQEQSAATYRTWRLALMLLRNFHGLVSREMAVDDPDWSEVPGGEELLSISPGYILEKEYQYALGVLVTNPQSASFEELATAFVLLLCYRFGLRGAEACGLRRSDWVDAVPDKPLVLVRSNKLRALKTINARRQVPLLFQLSALEHEIIDRYLALWQGHAMGQVDLPLFFEPGNVAQLINDRLVRVKLSKLLKEVTRNSSISLHHARHSFAFRAGELLIDDCEGVWPHASSINAPKRSAVSSHSKYEWRSHVRKLLLSHDHVTHRTLWAIARLLGHAHPTTAVRSYLHMVPELAERRVWSTTKPQAKRGFMVNAFNLDEMTQDPAYLGEYVIPVQPPRTITAGQVLRLLHLLGQGVPLERAAFRTDMPISAGDEVLNALNVIDTILRRRLKSLAESPHPVSDLLSNIRPARWAVLVRRANDLTAGVPELAPRSTVDELLKEMVGPSRHILLHKEEHFKVLKGVLTAWNFPTEAVTLVSARKDLHPSLASYAEKHQLPVSINVDKDAELSGLQVDSVEIGDPPVRVQHRVGAIARRTYQERISSYELVLLLIVSALLDGQ